MVDKKTNMENINKILTQDYFRLRELNCASNVSWNNVKHLNTPSGNTLWQLFSELEDYDENYEPSKVHISKIKKVLNYL